MQTYALKRWGRGRGHLGLDGKLIRGGDSRLWIDHSDPAREGGRGGTYGGQGQYPTKSSGGQHTRIPIGRDKSMGGVPFQATMPHGFTPLGPADQYPHSEHAPAPIPSSYLPQVSFGTQPSSVTSAPSQPLETIGQLHYTESASYVEEVGPSSHVRHGPTVSSRASRFPLRIGRSLSEMKCIIYIIIIFILVYYYYTFTKRCGTKL